MRPPLFCTVSYSTDYNQILTLNIHPNLLSIFCRFFFLFSSRYAEFVSLNCREFTCIAQFASNGLTLCTFSAEWLRVWLNWCVVCGSPQKKKRVTGTECEPCNCHTICIFVKNDSRFEYNWGQLGIKYISSFIFRWNFCFWIMCREFIPFHSGLASRQTSRIAGRQIERKTPNRIERIMN